MLQVLPLRKEVGLWSGHSGKSSRVAPLLLELWPEVPHVVPLALLRTPTELSLMTILYA